MKPTDIKTLRSGETVSIPGLYSSNCCGIERTFEVGVSYTRCPKCMSLCMWEPDETSEADDAESYVRPIAA